MSFFKEILSVHIKVKLSDDSEINISDPVKALEALQMLANGKPPLQSLPLSKYLMNTVTVKAYLRTIFSQAGWKWGKEGANLPLYDKYFSIANFCDNTQQALLKCKNISSLKIRDVVDFLMDPSKNSPKKPPFCKLTNRALLVFVMECVLMMHNLDSEMYVVGGREGVTSEGGGGGGYELGKVVTREVGVQVDTTESSR